MIKSIISDLGPWGWWIVALILMGLEILAPGTFFLWFGISAFIIGTISLAMGAESTFWVWQTQVIGFLVLSLVTALFARRYMNKVRTEDGGELRLNQRGAQLIGRTAVVNQAILQGQGRVRIGESTWRVTGPDMPEGSMVRIIAADGGTLIVEPVERTAG